MMFVPLLLQIHSGPMGVNPFAGPHTQKTYTYRVGAKPTIDLTTLNGRISVKTGPASTVTIMVNRRASTQAGVDALDVAVTQKGESIDAAGRFPADCGQTCGSVDFFVTVPSDASIKAQTDNGEIGVEGVSGAVDASTGHGPILCGNLSGDVTLSSKNGMLNAGFADLAHVSHVTLGTANGVVRVVLPAGASIGSIKAGTANGKIVSPLPLRVQTDGSGQSVNEQLSAHGPAFVLGTASGDVNIVVTKP